MKRQKISLYKWIAALLCFVMAFSIAAPVPAQAASKVELALKYKGKTLVVEKMDKDDPQDPGDLYQASLKKIEKAFGKAKKDKETGYYQYKEKGFLFEIMPWGDGKFHGLSIEITSKKATLNGIKVGMSYNKVKATLEKKYGKSRVITQKDKKQIQLTYGPYMPITYTFKNGKVSRMEAFHS